MSDIALRRKKFGILLSELNKLKEESDVKLRALVPLKERQVQSFLKMFPVNDSKLRVLEREISCSTGAPAGYASFKEGQIRAYWSTVKSSVR